MTKIEGYMVEAEWDGATLRARGTNKMGQTALRGARANEGDVVLSRDEMQRVEFKDASRLTNGNLVIHSADGGKYQLHFRRKQADEFRGLAQALGASGS